MSFGGFLRLGLTRSPQGLKHAGDQGGNITHRYSIVADKRGYDLGGQCQELLGRALSFILGVFQIQATNWCQISC